MMQQRNDERRDTGNSWAMARSSRAPRRHVNTHNSGNSLLGVATPSDCHWTKGASAMCWLFALARPATKSRGRAIAGPRNILLALAIVSAIAIGSENAAVEQEDYLDALEL